MINFVAVSTFLNVLFISSSSAGKIQDEDRALLNAMRGENLEAVFGPEVIQDAPVYESRTMWGCMRSLTRTFSLYCSRGKDCVENFSFFWLINSFMTQCETGG